MWCWRNRERQKREKWKSVSPSMRWQRKQGDNEATITVGETHTKIYIHWVQNRESCFPSWLISLHHNYNNATQERKIIITRENRRNNSHGFPFFLVTHRIQMKATNFMNHDVSWNAWCITTTTTKLVVLFIFLLEKDNTMRRRQKKEESWWAGLQDKRYLFKWNPFVSGILSLDLPVLFSFCYFTLIPTFLKMDSFASILLLFISCCFHQREIRWVKFRLRRFFQQLILHEAQRVFHGN